MTAALDGFPRSGQPTPVSPDYNNLKSQWATLSPSGVKLSAYSASTTSLSAPACPTSTPNGWLVDGTAPLPRLGQTLTHSSTAPGATQTGSATGSAASGSPTKGAAATGIQEVAGMSIGLAGVMLGFIVWL